MHAPLRIGTRNSPMALAQAHHVRELLEKSGVQVEIVGMQTSADAWKGSLATLGGKANFTKEIDAALLAEAVDIAVHCMKDVPGDVPLPSGTEFAAFLPRDDVRDVLVSPSGAGLAELPVGAVIGTSAVRRKAQLLAARSDLVVKPIRGNVNTRLAKLDAGEYDALVLALAGLQRLEMLDRVTKVFATTPGDGPTMLPAVGAGVLGIQVRSSDLDTIERIQPLNDVVTAGCVGAERAMLGALNGHCNSPIAGYARIEDGLLTLVGAVFDAEGRRWTLASEQGIASAGERVGIEVAAALRAQGAADLIAATRPE